MRDARSNPFGTPAWRALVPVALLVAGACVPVGGSEGDSDPLGEDDGGGESSGTLVAHFQAAPLSGDPPLLVAFQNQSGSAADGWLWDFGDGTTSDVPQPLHTYAEEGIYSVTLTKYAGGEFGTFTREYYVTVGTPEPIARLDAFPLAGFAPLEVQFADASAGPVDGWTWTFGDGGSSAEQNPAYTYAAPGVYPVSLTATGPGGTDHVMQSGYVTVLEPGSTDFAIEYGMNPSFNGWSDREVVFGDAMARALEFGLIVGENFTFDAPPLIPLGESPPRVGAGWPDFAAIAPGNGVGARLFNNMDGGMPDGRVTPYVLTWDGDGDVSLRGSGVVAEANRTSNRVEVYVDPTTQNGNALLYWRCDWSNPADPVRNAHVWLPGMEAHQTLLWPPYVARVKAMNRGKGPYSWRTLDWNRINYYGTNGNGAFTFDLAGRIFPHSPSQGTRRGVCPEFQVAFCNEVGANLHFQVPHRTNQMSEEDYATFVEDALVRIRDGSPAVPGLNDGQPFAGLDPALTVTLELSNEIWNSDFPAYAWMHQQADLHGTTWYQEIAEEIELVFGIADSVFGGADAPRLRKFVGAHTATTSYIQRVFDFLPPGFEVDALGPAGYFGPRKSLVQTWLQGYDGTNCPNCPTTEEVLAAASDRILDLRVAMRDHYAFAQSYTNGDGSHPALVLYEGGQAMQAGSQPWYPAAHAAQSRPELYGLYVNEMIPMLVEEGVALIHWYSFMSDQDAVGPGLGSFGVWNSMVDTITLPVPVAYLDEGMPKAAAIYRGPPLAGP